MGVNGNVEESGGSRDVGAAGHLRVGVGDVVEVFGDDEDRHDAGERHGHQQPPEAVVGGSDHEHRRRGHAED